MWKHYMYKNKPTEFIVSDYGEVYNIVTKSIAKQFSNNGGYLMVYLPEKGKPQSIHRMVAETFIPNPNNYPQVNHIDGVKTHNWVSNLEWCNASMNAKHAFENGLVHHARGEAAGASKYKNEQIHEVCKLLSTGKYTCTKIAEMTGVGRKMVNSIRLRQNWTHISKDYEFNDKPRPSHTEANAMADDMLHLGFTRDQIILKLKDRFGYSHEDAVALYKRRYNEPKRRAARHNKI